MCLSVCVCVCVRVCVRACVCMCGVVRLFYHSFSHNTTVAACCMRRISARVLSAANTDAPCRIHKTRVHHPVTLSWHRSTSPGFILILCRASSEETQTRDLPTTRRTLWPLNQPQPVATNIVMESYLLTIQCQYHPNQRYSLNNSKRNISKSKRDTNNYIHFHTNLSSLFAIITAIYYN